MFVQRRIVTSFVRVIDEAYVYVRARVELEAAELAHSQHDEFRWGSLGCARRPPSSPDMIPCVATRDFQQRLGKPRDLAGGHNKGCAAQCMGEQFSNRDTRELDPSAPSQCGKRVVSIAWLAQA